MSVVLNEKESVDTSRNLSTKATEVLSSEYESPAIPKRRTHESSIVEKEMSQNCPYRNHCFRIKRNLNVSLKT